MTKTSLEKLNDARAGKELSLICRMPSGWVFLCGMQFLRGYCILQADPVVESINSLKPDQRAAFLCDMVIIGDTVMEVTGAYRINYGILGNSEPILHAHITPRYLSEPEEYRKGLPWIYPELYDSSTMFDPVRDAELICELRTSLQRRLKAAGFEENSSM